MEGNRRSFSGKRPNSHFKTKEGNKRGKWHNSGHEQFFGNSNASDTVYRILCHSGKIGSVIGKGGGIVKALREETQAKIIVADSVPGSEERVIIIYSPQTKLPRNHSDEDAVPEKEDDCMEPHCAAQDALLKVHDRIIEEDLVGGMEDEDDNENVVTTRLLVPHNMVGCLLGKRGDVVQRLRSETGASIRVLPEEHLPTCAMNTDELVQISGKPAMAKRALYEVSTLLHQNPRKDNPPLSFPMPYGGPGFHPPGPPMPNMHPPGNPMWSEPRGMPPMPWMGEYGDQPTRFGVGGFDDVNTAHGGEVEKEFSMKILCSAAKIGGVIGKGGFNVKRLQQETGASIHVEDALAESEERVIRVSSFEALWNRRSQTIEAILQLQDKASEYSEKGVITTRLLIPSSKIGCILGQGGQVINEMRRRTQAGIRVYSKEDKPNCAAQDEELVQISGSLGVAKDALAEIASRLRTRCLRNANAGVEPAPVGPVKGFGTAGNLHGGGPHPPVQRSGSIRAASSSGYELVKGGGHGHDPPRSYPVPQSATRYAIVNSSMEVKTPNAVRSVVGPGGGSYSEISGTRVKLHDAQSGGSECVVEIRGSSDRLNAAQSVLQAFNVSTGQNFEPPQGSYQYGSGHQSAYSTINTPQDRYQNINTQRAPYQNLNTQQAPYLDINTQQASYQNMQLPYQNINSQQAPYQNINARQATYENTSVQGTYHY
ncbi:RNA-binding KH domain-containing protein RCF3-like [Cornus florida]|uniref:RNA-binding KH domain-containing protein RCF3-like n=1 Tax=Cornus florida TaxID=4283 RepID=UPI00289B69F1|nr:RNA-binding KH domain-containing protein RCF3-like [Cornus florida]